MARFDGSSTPGYSPVLRLWMREAPEGGALRRAVRPVWVSVAQRQSELLVLVHGFNNHQGEAETAYLGFRKRQRAWIPPGPRRDAFERLLGDAFWPGDAAWPGLLDTVDFLVYPSAVPVARDAGEVLADYLRGRAGEVLVVHFIGHSLGCRLVLETIERLRLRGAPRIGKVCLMAAAVPTFKTAPGGALHDALHAPRALRVLYSPADPVLMLAFPPGQTLAPGDEGFLPTAVGRHGDVPLSPGAIEREEIAGAVHGDYWGHRDNAASGRSAGALARFFDFAGETVRLAAARSLPKAPPPPAREAGTRRGIG